MALACVAAAGHFDELRGATAPRPAATDAEAAASYADQDQLTPAWGQFFEYLSGQAAADLTQRAGSLARQVRDDGVTDKVCADEDAAQHSWALNLFPLLIEPGSWQQIEEGVRQRMRLLERLMADVYGPQQSLMQGWLPPALVQGHPGYLRAMHGVKPVGGRHLHMAAFDLARGPDGNWWLVGQHCQAPSGLGCLLENRLAIASQFPEAFAALRVQGLAETYRALMDSLKMMSPAGPDAHLALLTPGPYNETYFEQAYLARYLGLSLVEGSDLVVRDERLYLKTLKGLVPVHGLLNRVNDEYLDPLELRADSTLGVPGLLQAIRAGHVLVANAPGSAFLESPALLGFLPALSRHLLGEELQLPALPTWWCGERSALEDALPRLRESAIKATYPGSPVHHSFDAVLGRALAARELDEWAGRIVRQGEEHTVQADLPLSQMPTWQSSVPANGANTAGAADEAAGQVLPRSVMLRVFVVSSGLQSWRVLPGGLARVAGSTADVAAMQRGGSSADVWALTRGDVDPTAPLQPPMTAASLAQPKRLVTRRAAENLFWLGRYTERTENALRLASLTLECLNGEDQSSPALLAWLGEMALANTLVLPSVSSALQERRVFERSLIASLASSDGATSVGYYLRALKMAASGVRERLSQAHWRVIVQAEEALSAGCAKHTGQGDFSSQAALRLLTDTGDHLTAITSAQLECMTRDDGWRLLSIGQLIERLGFLAATLARGFETGSVHTDAGVEAMTALFDGAIASHAQHRQSRDIADLLNLLVLGPDKPRSLAWVTHTLRERLSELADSAPGQIGALLLRIPDPQTWKLAPLCQTRPSGSNGYFFELNDLLLQCSRAAIEVSDAIQGNYFTHSGALNQSVTT
ncbi:MAG: circularly permuted type 2 ATP-grasp protein [Rhodoferax sp.]|nr:circularly permuted type 2 ATP-grasp protein [Rhodoferax sp.]